MAKKKPKLDAAGQRKHDFLALAQARFQQASEAESNWRTDGLDDLKFSVGQQWSPEVEAQRQQDARPCLVMNRLPQFIHQVTNQQRQERPSIQVNPVGSGADVKIAEIEQGIVRHIEVNSEAEIAYDHSTDMMVRTGKGAFRLLTEYADDDSDEQEIIIAWLENIFSLYTDPGAKKPDRSDMKWAFIVEDIARPEFLDSYEADIGSASDYQSIGDAPPGWVTKDTVRVAEYFYVAEDSIPVEGEEGETEAEPTDVETPTPKRKRKKRTIKWAKISAYDILEEGEWPGSWIPIIEVFGTDLIVDGKRHLSGMVRDAKDPQRMYNYWSSAATEGIALAPRAPFIGAKGQFENFETIWKQANTRNMAYLEYNPLAVGGQQIGPPERSQAEPAIQAMVLMLKQADNDLKASIGIYDASLGQKGPEQSGLAIERRQQQGDLATLNYSDNLSRAMRNCGRQILELIPKIYDTPRVQRIINPDQSVKQVITHVGEDQEAAAKKMADDIGIKEIYNIGKGKYDVTISVGPSFQTKRQEAVASQLDFVRSAPETLPIIGDMIVRNMDWPQADEIADRMKKMLPPQLQDQDEQNAAAQTQQLQQQATLLMAQNQQLIAHVNDMTQQINTKQVEQQGKMAIAKLQEVTKIAVAMIQVGNVQANIVADKELATLGMAHESGMHAVDTQAAEVQQRAQAVQDSAMQQQQQGHEQTMQAGQQGADAASQGADIAAQQQSQQSDQQASAQSQESQQVAAAESQQREHQHKAQTQKADLTAKEKLAKSAAKSKPKDRTGA